MCTKRATGEDPSSGAAKYTGLGVQLAVTLLVFVWVGQWVDERVGTDGVFTILLALGGFSAVLFSLIRQLSGKDDKDNGDHR